MAGSDPGSGPPDASARRLRTFLIVSLALNLLLMGAIAGSLAWRRHGPGHPGMRGEDFGLMGFTRSLPSERRDEIRKLLKEQRGSLKPLKTEIIEARREAAEVLGAEPFDGQKLRAAIDKIAEAEGRFKSSALSVLLSTAEKLTAEERRALADFLKSRHGPGKRDKGGPEGEKSPPEG